MQYSLWPSEALVANFRFDESVTKSDVRVDDYASVSDLKGIDVEHVEVDGVVTHHIRVQPPGTPSA